jgi:hypothetical protein
LQVSLKPLKVETAKSWAASSAIAKVKMRVRVILKDVERCCEIAVNEAGSCMKIEELVRWNDSFLTVGMLE